ncbi:hypothetical protein EBR96_02975 [bacterium]|nr:hypothetical protein [bacterium]
MNKRIFWLLILGCVLFGWHLPVQAESWMDSSELRLESNSISVSNGLFRLANSQTAAGSGATGVVYSVSVKGIASTINAAADGGEYLATQAAIRNYVDAVLTYAHGESIRRSHEMVNSRNMVGMVAPFVVSTNATSLYGGKWLLCDGRGLSRNDYPLLFGMLGYAYGRSGDLFAIPDLQTRVAIGSGGSYNLNDSGGTESVTLTAAHIPNHTHNITETAHSHELYEYRTNYDQDGADTGHTSYQLQGSWAGGGGAVTFTVFTNSVTPTWWVSDIIARPSGKSPPDPVSILKPYQVISYFIRVLP